MIESADIRGVATTTTVAVVREGVSVTISGIPATAYGDNEPWIDGPLAERIDDGIRALLDTIAPRRAGDGPPGTSGGASAAAGGARGGHDDEPGL